MSRRARAPKRDIAQDIRHNNLRVAIFINHIMRRGKKSVASRIMYDSFALIEDRMKRRAIEVFEQAVKTTMPSVEGRPPRVGCATYQVRVEVASDPRQTLS